MSAQLKLAKISISPSVHVLLSLIDALFYNSPTFLKFLLQAKVVEAFALHLFLSFIITFSAVPPSLPSPGTHFQNTPNIFVLADY